MKRVDGVPIFCGLTGFAARSSFEEWRATMKEGIHPEYRDAVIVCACGNRIETRSTMEEIHVEICAACHPFYTGKQRLVDTAGRVERFQKKYQKTGK